MQRYGISSQKAGLPPGALIHVGDVRAERATITALQYTDKQVIQQYDVALTELHDFAKQQGIVWLQIAGLGHVSTVEKVGSVFGIHDLALEDILNTNQRPKYEDYGEYVYIAVKFPGYDPELREVTGEHLNLIVGKNFVLSFQETSKPLFRPIEDRIKGNPERFFKHGPGYLAYALLDTVVDCYFVTLEQLGERVEELEEQLIEQLQTNLLPAIHSLKKEMLFLRRSVWPLREVVAGIERGASPLFQESTLIYIRDVYDHTIQAIETLETYRDMTSGMVDIYLSGVSNRMNEVVKMLTVISTIFMPLTFLAGVYGMNFENMPELKWEYGYPAVLVLMGAIGIFMYRYFRTRQWI